MHHELCDDFAHGNQQFSGDPLDGGFRGGGKPSPESAAALERLCTLYWYPLYAFVRRSGYAPADAEDLTQEFFARLLQHNRVAAADPHAGEFDA